MDPRQLMALMGNAAGDVARTGGNIISQLAGGNIQGIIPLLLFLAGAGLKPISSAVSSMVSAMAPEEEQPGELPAPPEGGVPPLPFPSGGPPRLPIGVGPAGGMPGGGANPIAALLLRAAMQRAAAGGGMPGPGMLPMRV